MASNSNAPNVMMRGRRITEAAAESLARERQQQLPGAEFTPGHDKIAKGMNETWWRGVYEPTCRIAGDPAASRRGSALLVRQGAARITHFQMECSHYKVDGSGKSVPKKCGTGSLEHQWAAVDVTSQLAIQAGRSTVTIPVEAGFTAFRVAHERDRPNEVTFRIKSPTDGDYPRGVRRGARPVLYEIQDQRRDSEGRVNAEDSPVFDLIHRPERVPLPSRQDAAEPLRHRRLRR